MKTDSSKSSDSVNEDQNKLSSLTSVVIDEEERREALNHFHFSPDGLASKRLIDAIENKLKY